MTTGYRWMQKYTYGWRSFYMWMKVKLQRICDPKNKNVTWKAKRI